MNNFKNPLDNLPTIPVDYANHVVYGGVLAFLFALALHFLGSTAEIAYATLCTFVVSGVKKILDYFLEHEAIAMCLSKTVVTAAVPGGVYLLLQILGK